MPTHHVQPESDELLQEIADALGKAKKVLVVTGAGISTNSGIPDFRSQNGLYSLIQAQFEAAAGARDGEPGDERGEPATKRRRLSEGPVDDTIVCSAASSSSNSSREKGECIVVQLPELNPPRFASSSSPHTPQRRPPPAPGIPAPSDPAVACPAPHPHSSSPLSSPPSILFDPTEEFRTGSATSAHSSLNNSSVAASSTTSSSDCESDSESESDEGASASQPAALSSQSSFASARSTLPVMKGRDLFDASIWADPVKTSVFYTFATTLRQKVREVAPTRSHEFISHLRDANKLVRCYTQNIDEIEEKVGLTTSLVLGPGKKGRFSARATARASTGAAAGKEETELPSSQEPANPASAPSSQSSQSDALKPTAAAEPCVRGVECVFLHGSLRLLRCFRCGHTAPWDEDGREHETLSGRQPSCPRCAGATAAREGRGKRALAVGKLRPDIVLYGEDNPNAHLISPIVQHDIALAPDLLLILGTSLRVHGLKVLIREFSKAVHSRGGKVVFVNFTKPPESVWSDVIDYWVQWDCDAWVQDLRVKKPALWLPPGSVVEEPKKKRKSVASGGVKGGQPTKKEPEAAGLAAASAVDAASGDGPAQADAQPPDLPKHTAAARRASGPRKPRHSAPAALPVCAAVVPQPGAEVLPDSDKYSILSAVKANPRRRRSKKLFEAGAERGPVVTEALPARPQFKGEERPPFIAEKPRGPALAWSETDQLLEQARMDFGLPMAQSGTETAASTAQDASASSAPCASGSRAPGSPRPKVSLAHLRPLSHALVLPPIRAVFPWLKPQQKWSAANAFFYQDPLIGHYGLRPPWPQDCSCTDQLNREADEHWRATVDSRVGRRRS